MVRLTDGRIGGTNKTPEREAAVERRTEGKESIDLVLAGSLDAWRRLPEVEREIDSWDQDDAVDYLCCWPVQEVRLERLADEAREGEMTDEQLRSYSDLLDVVATNRPIIERLLLT